jgi:hypothetical protein
MRKKEVREVVGLLEVFLLDPEADILTPRINQ